jgi:hypothetical protein
LPLPGNGKQDTGVGARQTLRQPVASVEMT